MKKWMILLVLCAGLTEMKAQEAEIELSDGGCQTEDAGWLMEDVSIGMASESVVVKEGHDWTRFVLNTAVSVGVAFGTKTILKSIIHEDRPDHSDNKSFPSGHAAMAFAAARSLDKEFRRESIWIPIAGYAAATAIGVERVVSDRHHWYDVAAGAAIGLGAAELTWWVSDKLFGKDRRVAVGYSGSTLDLVYCF
jgi:hypothetical protein